MPPVAALEFASPWMLGWLAAAALPWLINLWTRRRHVETAWAAVELLMAAVRERSRRIRLRELLLLALRTAILLLVALAAARPLWRTASAGGGTAERTHYVLVIDQSMSMSARADESTRLERAQARARQIVEDAAAGDAFTTIAWADTADNVLGRPTFERMAALQAIEAIEPLDTAANLSAALRAVETAIGVARREFPGLRRTRTVFVSDLAINTWAAALPGDQVSDERLKLPAGAEIESVDEGARQNLAIAGISLEPAGPILDRPFEIVVQLKAFGREPVGGVGVELFVDGDRIGRQHAEFSAGGEGIARFETRLVEPGRHVIEARLPADADVLFADNRRWLVAEARQARRALLVADVARAAEDIARALNPRFRDAAGGDAIQVDIIATAGLERAELRAYDAVFLANVAELSEREQRLLQRYIEDGGAAVLVLGERIHATGYNRFLEEIASLTIAEEPAQGDWRLDPLDYRHPILAPFAGRKRSGLLGVRVSQYYPLRIAEDDRAEAALAFSSGDPAIVIGEHGRGRLAVIATDPALETQGEPWSTLAVSPSFVPLVRELLGYLTSDRRGEQLNRLAGEPLVLNFSQEAGAAVAAEWKDPAGNVSATPPDCRRVGIYAGDGEAIAVNFDPAESDLAAIDVADLQKSTPVESRAVGSSAADAASRSLASFLLGAAAALMLVELTIAWLLGRGWA